MGTRVTVRFVVDNSVTMRWRFDGRKDHVAYAAAVQDMMVGAEEAEALVPPIWHMESAHVILYEKTGKTLALRKISEADTVAFAEELRGMDIQTFAEVPTVYDRRLLLLARDYGLSVYDAAYLDLAMREGIPLATNDERLARAARAAGVPLLLGGHEAFA